MLFLIGTPSKSCNEAGVTCAGLRFRLVGEGDRERDDGLLDNKWAEVAITVAALQLCHSDRVLLSIHNPQPKMKRCVVGIRRPRDPTYPTSKREGHGVEPAALATEFLIVLSDPRVSER